MADKQHRTANPEQAKAMHALRSSNAAVPQESRDKRLRTKQAIIAQAKKEAA